MSSKKNNAKTKNTAVKNEPVKAEAVKTEKATAEANDKTKKYIKPAWLPWVVIVVELVAVILIGYLVCRAAAM